VEKGKEERMTGRGRKLGLEEGLERRRMEGMEMSPPS